MNIKFLQTIIESYKLTAAPFLDTEAEQQQAIDQCDEALKELQSIADALDGYDPFNGECYVVHATDACDLMNMVTYDDYGRQYVKNNGQVTFDEYRQAVSTHTPLSAMSNQLLELGYEIVSDLYADNESLGCHNQDGTFNKDK